MLDNKGNSVVAAVALTLMSAITFAADETTVSQADDTMVSQKDIWALVQEEEDGYRAGSFLLQPEVSLSGVYDSNIFATRTNEVEDSILVFSPILEANSMWERHKLDFDLGGAFGRYTTNDNEDYDDYWANLDGRYDFTDNSNVFGGLGYSHEHEDRGSPEAGLSGIDPTVFDSSRVHAGASHSC